MTDPNSDPWQPYVNKLIGTGHIDKAALIGIESLVQDINRPYAISPDFALKYEETKEIYAILQGEGDTDKPAVSKALSEGIYVAGERYVAFNIAGSHIYGRKGKTGVIIVQTNRLIIIAQYGEDKGTVSSTDAVLKFAKDFLDVNY